MKSMSLLALTGALHAATAIAKPVCNNYNVKLSVTSKDLVYALPPFKSDFDVANFIDDATSRSAKGSDALFEGSKNETACYDISATFCHPEHGKSQKDTVLIATHGLNYDGGYWNPDIDSKYSFVDFAVAKGYSVLYYDRLGTGKSSKVSGYKAQLSNQVAILQKLIEKVKQGKVNGEKAPPKNVVLVGHSFGSAISLGAAGNDPTATDGLILTGFGLNSTYLNPNNFLLADQPRIASQQRPKQWRDLDTGYLTGVDLYSNVNTFFKAPDYDPKVAKYADDHKAPMAVTELLTVSAIEKLPTSYTGATMILSGKYDFIICQSDCDGILEEPANSIFSHAKDFKAVSYPGAGHGVNFHLNAQGAFKEITDFLGKNDL